MCKCKSKLLSVVVIALTIFGVTYEAEASRRKPRRPIIAGEIQAISPGFVILKNTRIELTSRTVYRDHADAVISRSAFVAGDCVKVKLVPGRPVPTAREMELDDHCSTPNSSGSNGAGAANPSLGEAGDDKGGLRNNDGRDDSRQDDCDDRGRGRGRGRGRDDR